MKSILSTILGLVVSLPAIAQYDHNRPHRHYHHRHNQWVAPAILGAMGTMIIIDQYGRQRQVTIEPVNQPIVNQVVVPSQTVFCTEWREVQEPDGKIYKERFCRTN